MSLFYCLECDRYADGGDGSGLAANGRDLICAECAEEAETDLQDMVYAHAQGPVIEEKAA